MRVYKNDDLRDFKYFQLFRKGNVRYMEISLENLYLDIEA